MKRTLPALGVALTTALALTGCGLGTTGSTESTSTTQIPVELGHDLAGLQLELPARRCQPHLVRVACDQPHFQGFLQFLQLGAQARLGQMQTLRRTPEMQFLGERDERDEMAEFHDGGSSIEHSHASGSEQPSDELRPPGSDHPRCRAVKVRNSDR